MAHPASDNHFDARFMQLPKMPADIPILKIEGNVTYQEAPKLRKIIFEHLRTLTPSDIVVELGDVSYIDTAGVAVLVEGLVASKARGFKMLLCKASESVLKTFDLAGLDDALNNCCACENEVKRKLAN